MKRKGYWFISKKKTQGLRERPYRSLDQTWPYSRHGSAAVRRAAKAAAVAMIIAIICLIQQESTLSSAIELLLVGFVGAVVFLFVLKLSSRTYPVPELRKMQGM